MNPTNNNIIYNQESQDKKDKIIKKSIKTFKSVYYSDKQFKWILKDFLPLNNLSMIVAEGGLGKSMLSLYLAYYLANPENITNIGDININNKKLFGKFNIDRTYTSLFLQTENDTATCKERIKKIANNFFKKNNNNIIEPILDSIYTIEINNEIMCPSMPIIKHGESNYFKKFIREVVSMGNNLGKKIDIIWFDPLISFLGCDENSNSDLRQHLDALKEVCTELEVTPIVIHHTKKDGNGYRGASSIQGAVRNLIELSKTNINIKNKNKITSKKCICVKHIKSNLGVQQKDFNIFMDNNFCFNSFDNFDINNNMNKINTLDVNEVVETLKILTQLDPDKDINLSKLSSKYSEITGKSISTSKRKIAQAVKIGLIKRQDLKNNKSKFLLN